MKNRDYWRGRFALLEDAMHKRGASYYKDVEYQFRLAQRQIDVQIESWYQRFATNNGVTMLEARKMLNAKELAELKWDVKEYIKYGEQVGLNPTWMKQLENASARYHISRLEALKLQTQQSIEVLYGNQTDGVDSLMKKIYSDGYYHAAYEIQKGFNVGWAIASIDQSKLEKVISRPWATDGRNFSDRIWTNKSKLINELHTELTQMCILGKGPDTAIKNIAKKMNVSRANAGRLVMTESSYFSSVAQKDCFDALDVERYEIVATLDSLTSPICQELDGKVFEKKDFEPGVTANPFHVGCRSTTVPFFDDEWSRGGKRAARDKDGKTYYVSDDMTYKEWKKSLAKSDDSGLNYKGKHAIMKGKLARVNLNALSSQPDKIAQINYNDKDEVINTLLDFEKQTINFDVEMNCTVTSDGWVWQLKGDENSVNPSLIEIAKNGSSLLGSYSYHNHPSSVTNFSFSANDFAFFLEHQEAYSRASDYKYWYVMKSTPKTELLSYDEATTEFEKVFKNKIFEMAFNNEIDIDEDGYHKVMEILSDKFKFYYERGKF